MFMFMFHTRTVYVCIRIRIVCASVMRDSDTAGREGTGERGQAAKSKTSFSAIFTGPPAKEKSQVG